MLLFGASVFWTWVFIIGVSVMVLALEELSYYGSGLFVLLGAFAVYQELSRYTNTYQEPMQYNGY